MLLSILLQAVAGAGLAKLGSTIGAGVIVFGAALGIGRIGGQAMDAIARQPESANEIRSNMIVIAALIEGIALFALAVCFLVLFVQ